MGYDLITCIKSCHSANNSGALVGNDSYDLECITQCSQQHATLFNKTAKEYTHILQIIAVVLLTFGLFGKVFNSIIFLRKPLRGTSTGLLLLLKTLFDSFPLLWTFIFDTKFFVQDEQINASRILCILIRSSDIFVSWSIGFVILACTIRLVTIVHSKHILVPTRLQVVFLIILMMICGLIYNWHIFYYPNLVTLTYADKRGTFTYCNILFGRQMGYFSFDGFQVQQEFIYNAPIVNFIVSSLIPFTIVASTNVVIILYVLKIPSLAHHHHHHRHQEKIDPSKLNIRRRSLPHIAVQQLTRKDVSYETTITLTTSCVFLTTNSIASIYVYVKSSHRASRLHVTEELKASNVYLILRMLTLIDTVLEFYIYFLTGRKFREEVYELLKEIRQYLPWINTWQFTRVSTTTIDQDERSKFHSGTSSMKSTERDFHSSRRWKNSGMMIMEEEETLDRIESTV